MFIGQFSQQALARGKEEEEPAQKKKPPEEEKSGSAEEFIKTPEAKKFIDKWYTKTKEGKPMYTKRGIVALLKALFQIPGLGSNKEVTGAADDLLSQLGGMDGLQGFLMGWKAKSEGIIKGIKSIFGGS